MLQRTISGVCNECTIIIISVDVVYIKEYNYFRVV